MATSVSPARSTALEILVRVASENAYASTLLATVPSEKLSAVDRALATELVLGTLRWQGLIDYLIEQYSGRKTQKLDLPVVIALRLGIYQIRFLSKIPVSAAVNESVNLTKRARLASAAPFVNAVLRRAVTGKDGAVGDSIPNFLDRAAVQLSHPRWMLERWAGLLGDEQMKLLALANNSPAQSAFRVNSLKATPDEVFRLLDQDGVKWRTSDVAPGAYIAERGSGLSASQVAKKGFIYIQDEASQLVSIMVNPNPGDRILDLCAAPGSKSTHLAHLSGASSFIVAGDLYPNRLRVLTDSAKRLGISNLSPIAFDASAQLPFSPGAEQFDRVLLDAPCSGTGTLRQNPEIKWRLAPRDISRLPSLQSVLITNAAEMMKPGGKLVYSVCSMEPEEGEGVVQSFLATETGGKFRIVPFQIEAPVITVEGFVRTYPHLHGCDGFFAAILERIAS